MADVRGYYKPFFLFAAVFFALYCVLIFVANKENQIKQPPLYLSVDHPLIQLGRDVNTVHSTSEQNCRRKNMNTIG